MVPRLYWRPVFTSAADQRFGFHPRHVAAALKFTAARKGVLTLAAGDVKRVEVGCESVLEFDLWRPAGAPGDFLEIHLAHLARRWPWDCPPQPLDVLR